MSQEIPLIVKTLGGAHFVVLATEGHISAVPII